MAKAVPEMHTEGRRVDQATAANMMVSDQVQKASNSLGYWGKRMSDNVAYALLVYTGLQIFVTVHALRNTGSSALPMLALVVLVLAIIPLCRRFEKRWESVAADRGDRVVAGRYRRDQMMLWGMAAGLPFFLTGLFKALVAVV